MGMAPESGGRPRIDTGRNVTPLRVIQVSEAAKVEANCVYVIASGKNLLMTDGQLVLNDLRHDNGTTVGSGHFFFARWLIRMGLVRPL
jgi:hypothetical protein